MFTVLIPPAPYYPVQRMKLFARRTTSHGRRFIMFRYAPWSAFTLIYLRISIDYIMIFLVKTSI